MSEGTRETTYLVVDLDAFPGRNDAPDDATIHRPELKALTRALLRRLSTLVNVTVKRGRRSRVVLFVGARQAAAIRLG
jgi:hypothetical protein